MPDPKPSLDALRIDRSGQRGVSEAGRGGVLKWLVILGLAGAAGFWYWKGRETLPEVTTVMVRAESGTAAARSTLLNGSGYITARRAATVSSKVTGKVVEVLIEEGKSVKAGDLLARIDDSNVQASLQLAEAQLLAARSGSAEIQANLEFARQEEQRYAALVKSNAASVSDLNKTAAAARALEARLQAQQAQITVAEKDVAQWKQQVEDTFIRAPFSGMVTTKNAQPGEMISPMSVGGFTRTGVCTIVDMASLEIEVDVNESFINRVQPSQPVEASLDSYPDVKFPARVIAIIPTADRQKATVKVRVGFEKLDPRILPEMAVKVAFQQARTEPAPDAKPSAPLLLVPKNAVTSAGGLHTVWVVSNQKVEKRAVALGTPSASGEETAIASGVSAGETLVLKSSLPLQDGQKVSLSTR